MSKEIKVKVFTTQGCANCLKSLKLVNMLKEKYALKIEEVDVTQHPEEVMEYGIMASGSIVLNNELAFNGAPSEDALRAKLDQVTSGNEG